MFKKNTEINYTILVLRSIEKKCFSALGKIIKKSGDTVVRMLRPAEEIVNIMEQKAVRFFEKKKQLVLIVDDTLIKKVYAQNMEGAGRFFDTKIYRKIMSYKLICIAVTDGIYTLPLGCNFAWDSEIIPDAQELKMESVKTLILKGLKLFSDKKITVTFDGAFATIEMLKWALDNKINVEARMHRNRKVLYKGINIAIRDIKKLIPKGRHMACTVQVRWHDMSLYITAQRRIDKHSEESIVYQVSNYLVRPSVHVASYIKRWPIEKMFRTSKQLLGLQDCASTKLETQLSHATSVLLAYTYAQIYRRKHQCDTPEDAIRSIRAENFYLLNNRINRLDEIFEHA